MGRIKRKRPRRGSLQYWPRKRSRRSYPIVKNWPKISEQKPVAFLGYKAGMSRITLVDNRKKSITKGEELTRAVTVLEVPPLKVFGLRIYKIKKDSLVCIGESWTDKFDKELHRRLSLPKKNKGSLKNLEKNIDNALEVRLLVHTQPKLTFIGKKKPEIIEIPIGGDNVKENFEYAKKLLGSEIKAVDVLKEGNYLDVHSITTGKGFQGVIKRFGVKRKRHKSEKGVRRVGTLGSWNAITWRVPHPGQMGGHQRTEKHKFLFKIASSKDKEITPKGGFLKYGLVKNDYLIIDGSVPGPKKRLVILTPSMKPPEKGLTQPPEIVNYSLDSQQG